jgi:hypothetical protein
LFTHRHQYGYPLLSKTAYAFINIGNPTVGINNSSACLISASVTPAACALLM